MSRGKDFEKDEFGRYVIYCSACKCKVPHVKGMCLGCKAKVEEQTVYSQPWRCKACGTAGSTLYIDNEPYKNIIDRIIAEHRNKTKVCPGKLNDLWIYPLSEGIN